MKQNDDKFEHRKPNRRPDEDTCTPAELLDIIEQKGREVRRPLWALRAMQEAESESSVN